jgi:hypothetical protein
MRAIIDGQEHTAETILLSLPARFHPLYRVRPGVCQFHIEGPGGGDYATSCDGGVFRVTPGVARAPACTVSVPDVDFVGWCLGRLRDHDLLAAGRLRITGDPELLFSMVMMMTTGVPRAIQDAVRRVDEQFRGRPMPVALDRVSELSPAYLRQAAREKTPFILTGVTAGWNSASWSLASLKERFGHIPFPVRKISASSPWVALFPLGSGRADRGTMRLGDFIDAILASRPGQGSAPHTDLMSLPDELAGELGPLPVFPAAGMSRRRPELFLSAASAYTGVHRDLEDGVSCVFIGRRRFRLWSPDQASWLYAMPNLHPAFQACFLDARRPDPVQFPLFERAVSLEVTLEHGEALYLPFGWFHDVSVLEHGLTIRFDYHHDFHELLA